MFSLIPQVFIILLNFSSTLAIKYVSLNDKPCMIRPPLINLNPVKLKYDLFMISLDKCSGSRNVLLPKICFPKKKTKKTKDIHVKVFNMITIKNEAKTIAEHVSCDCKCKFNSITCNSN